MKNNINTQEFETPVGILILGSYNDKLCLCDWKYRAKRTTIDQRILKGLQADFKNETSDVIEQAKTQLNEYFKIERTTFDIPLLFVGSKFQQQVWQALLEIPYGKTNSYLDLSKQLKNEKAIRAVASANGANGLSIFVPCHRIIGSDGSLTGYAGGLTAKKQLLQLENAFPSEQLDLF